MSLIASTSTDFKCHRWPEGTVEHVYVPQSYHDGIIKSISWSKDGNWVTLVPFGGPAEVIGVKDNIKLLHSVQDISNPSCAIFQNETKKYLAFGTPTGYVFIYDIKAKGVRKKLPRASSEILGLSYNAKDSHLAAASLSGEIILYSSTTNTISKIYRVPKSDTVSVVNFHRTKRNYLTAGSEEGVVCCWDINTNEPIFTTQAHQAAITAIAFSPIRSDLLATAGLDRRFTFYDILSKTNILDVGLASCVTAADYSYCGKYLGLGSQDGNIAIYDIRSFNKPILTFVAHEGRKIRNLLFQKTSSHNSELIELAEVIPDNPQVPMNNSSDCSRLMLSTTDTPPEKGLDTKNHNNHDTADSFMAEMGLNNTTSHISKVENSGSSEPSKKVNYEPLKSILQNHGKIATPTLQMASTPKYFMEDLPETVESPIIAISQKVHNEAISNISKEELMEVFRNVVKEEIQVFKNDMKTEIANEISQLRRMLLDLHMTVVKQNVNVEDSLNKINGSTTKNYNSCEDLLIQTIHGLKQQIATLQGECITKEQ